MNKRIIPCLDFYNGRIVKGVKFNNLVDIGDPLDLAKFYNDEGADELVILNINSTIENKFNILKYICKISSNIFIPLTVGGGIKNLSIIKNYFNSGADKISINSSLINNLNFINKINKIYGSQCLIASLDAKFLNINDKYIWTVFKNSGKIGLNKNILDLLIKYLKYNVGEFLITSIDHDGSKLGYDFNLLYKIINICMKSLIISGGFKNLNDLLNILKLNYIEGILIASNLHNKKYSIYEIKNFLINNGILTRC